MDLNVPLRAFISYTAQDLAAHADVVLGTLRALEVVALDHRTAIVTGEPSVAWCKEQIATCDFVIVLLAHRYGWVPDVKQGGDGQMSITHIEVQHARRLQKYVLPFLIADDASWPTNQIEALTNTEVRGRLESFRGELRNSFAGFFNEPSSLDGPVSRSVERIRRLLATSRAPPPRQQAAPAGQAARTVPWIFSRDQPPTVSERMDPSLPKRVLCIDSASAETAVTLGYLNRLEGLLQMRYAEPDFRLCDYFDLVVGSGFGAIAAADLALGSSVAQTRDWMSAQLPKVFGRRSPILKRLKYGYDPKPLSEALEARFQDRSFDPTSYRTGLALIGTRLELGIPVHISNHPEDASKYPELLLSSVLLGCSSWLTYLPPVALELGVEGRVALCAADVAGAGNPCLYVLLMIANRRFAFRWPMGRNRLAVFSIGGLVRSRRKAPDKVLEPSLLEAVQLLAGSFDQGTSHIARLVMDSLAVNDLGADGDHLSSLTYHRFEVTSKDSAVATGELADLLARADEMSFDERLARWNELTRLGQTAAEAQILPDTFGPAFDVRRLSE